MAGVARHSDRFFSQTQFYAEAANGTLPAFSYFAPAGQASDHPCNDIAKGERLLKDVYEALRAGPKWNETLFLVAYDDIGGYFDPIIPPFEGVPAPNAPCNSLNEGYPDKFDFRRLGGRSTALLMGGRVPRRVFQEPQHGPFNTSHFDLASVCATTRTLFNLSTPLTERTMWAGTFEELLLDDPRLDTDTPLHLPDAPPAAEPWTPPPPGGEGGEGVNDDGDDGDNGFSGFSGNGFSDDDLMETEAEEEEKDYEGRGGNNNGNGDDDDDGDRDGEREQGRRRRRRYLSYDTKWEKRNTTNTANHTVNTANTVNKPQHCGAVERTCRPHDVLTRKQEHAITHYASLTNVAKPVGMERMTPAQADQWIARNWELWRARGHPTN
jgi:hypothetical protein